MAYKPYGRLLTDAQELKISKMYLKGYNITELQNIFSLGEKTIRNALRRTNTPKRSKSEAILGYYKTKSGKQKSLNHSRKIRKHTANDNFFALPLNKTSAYVLGFWIADGHIEKRNGNLLGFSQTGKDILLKIKKALQATNPISPANNGGHRLIISSRQLCDDIRAICKFDESKNKSLVADYPNIPKALDSHFILGIFDGDGGIYRNRKGQLVFTITGTVSLNTKIQSRLIKYCGVKKTKMIYHDNFSQLHYTGNKQVKRILDWLYNDATIFMNRKKRIYDSLNH